MKKKIADLEKCYAIAPLKYNQRSCFLVAAEKKERCLLFSEEGTLLDTVWTGPGGVMTMEQIPGMDGCFLATHEFYSPNDSANARIVAVRPEAGEWRVQTLTPLPFVHRFGILTGADGCLYLAAATLKSAHAFKNDWTCPGRIWAAEFPEHLSSFSEEHPLEMKPILSALYHNHGFCKSPDGKSALFGSDNGVFRITPPSVRGGDWNIECLLNSAVSDMTLIDLDMDGVVEMIVYAPFHGENLSVYKPVDGSYRKVWSCDHPLPFLHAIWSGRLHGVPTVLIGHREGNRDLLMLRYHDDYALTVLDHDVGPANVLVIPRETGDVIISANREIDEVAYYI